MKVQVILEFDMPEYMKSKDMAVDRLEMDIRPIIANHIMKAMRLSSSTNLPQKDVEEYQNNAILWADMLTKGVDNMKFICDGIEYKYDQDDK